MKKSEFLNPFSFLEASRLIIKKMADPRIGQKQVHIVQE